MAFDEGFNFRDTAAFVTDPADTQFCGADAPENSQYPTTANGVTFGWDGTTNLTDANRDSGIDARLAGVILVPNTAQRVFRVDLPNTGNYTVHVAAGDQSVAYRAYWQILDDASVLATHDNTASAQLGGRFYDETDVVRLTAAWPSDEVGVEYTFSSSPTIFRLKLGGNNASASTSSNSPIAHLRIVEVGGGGATVIPVRALLGVGL